MLIVLRIWTNAVILFMDKCCDVNCSENPDKCCDFIHGQMLFFSSDTTLMLRLWACAMMINFL